MAQGLTTHLLIVALCVGVGAMLLALRDLPPTIAAIVVSARLTLPLVYFAWFFDFSHTLTDGAEYFDHGLILVGDGFNPLTALCTSDGLEALRALAGGHHILYSWWNLLAVWLFGEHYYAPVFLNILLTFVTGYVFARLLRQLDFDAAYRRWAIVFVLLHWDMVAWSSAVNLKGVMVQTLTVAGLYFGVCFFRQRRLIHLVGFVGVSLVFLWIRFYIPFLLLLAAATYMVVQWKDPRKYLLLPVAILVGWQALPWARQYREYMDTEHLLYGSVRFLLTPIPWKIQEGYHFLALPAVLHWLFFIPALLGVCQLWRRSPLARLIVLYAVGIVAFYALTEILQGPRHRFQVAFIFAWAQFHFLWQLLPSRATSGRRASLPQWSAAYP